MKKMKKLKFISNNKYEEVIILDGIQNEYDFVLALNNKRKNELNPILQDLMYYLFGNFSEYEVIKSWRNKEKQKEDIFIKVNGQVKGISIKMGSRNSVHVESLKSFVKFLKSLGIDKKYIDIFLKYQYGFGDEDGNVTAASIKEKHQKEIDEFNKVIATDEILEKAVYRFVLQGNNSDYWIAAIVHGTPQDFVWLSKDNIIKILKEKIDDYSTAIHFSKLTCQPMTRCLNNNMKYQRFTKYVQIKWYSLFDDIVEYMNDYAILKSFNDE